MRARPGVALALLALLLLAGCAQHASPAAPPAPADDRQARQAFSGDDVMDALLEAGSCVGWSQVAEVDAGAVTPELPSGFLPAVVLGAVPINNPHLTVLRCDRVLVDNRTREEGVTLAYTGTLLGNGDFYRWETFVDEPEPHAIVASFAAAGWPVQAANVTMDATGGHVRADGVAYDVLAPGPHVQRASPPAPAETSHNVGPDGVHRRSRESLWTGTNLLTAAPMQAQGGVWSRIAQRAGPGSVSATVSDLNTSLRVEVYG